MADNKFILKFSGDTTELKNAVEKANATVSGFASSVKGMAASIAAGFAVTEIAAFGKEAAKMAIEAVAGEEKLLTALKGRTDIQTRLLEQAEYLHSTSLFEDDEIVKQQALLAALGRNEQQIKSIIEAAVNLSAATGTDLGSATEALNKSLSGNIKSLASIDPEFKKVTSSAAANGEAIRLATEKYNGFAEAATSTAEGPLKMFDKNLSDLKENIGRSILPAFNDLIIVMNKVFFGTNEAIQVNQRFVDVMVELKKARQQAAASGDIEEWSRLNKMVQEGTEKARAWYNVNVANKGVPSKEVKELADAWQAAADKGERYRKLQKEIMEQLNVSFQSPEAKVSGGPATKIGPLGPDPTGGAFQSTEVEITRIQELIAAHFTEISTMAQSTGEIIGMAIGGAFNNQTGIAQLRAMTLQVVDLFQKQALAAIVAKATKDGVFKPGVGTIAAIAAATAGFAAIKSLFSKIGGSGGGGGIGGMASGGGGGVSGTRLESLGQRVQLVGNVQFDIAGDKLVGVLKNQDRFNSRTKTT